MSESKRFSRRHVDAAAHMEARAKREVRREMKMERAKAQNAATAARKAKGEAAPESFKASKRARGLVA